MLVRRPAGEALRSDPRANLLAGGVGGLGSLVVGYPFDTVKVRLQSCPQLYTGGWDCFRKIISTDGARSIYKGLSGLAATSIPRFSLLFYTNSLGRNLYQSYFPSPCGSVGLIIGGCVFSQLIVVPLLVNPLERIKILMQVNPTQFSSQRSCFNHVLRTEGLRGFSRGTLFTLARDIPSFCTYFLVYECLRARVPACVIGEGRGSAAPSLLSTGVCGSIAGMAGWLVALPLDCLKTRHQLLLSPLLPNQGLRGLYRGLGVVLLRAAPANAATFIGYEYTLKALDLLNQPVLVRTKTNYL